MRVKFILLVYGLMIAMAVTAQQNVSPAKPKLVVGLVIDQMRWDYLYRYQQRYVQGGFNRLTKNGFSFENTFIQYLPSYTAVGHSTIYTGSVPAFTGIIGNNWYDRSLRKGMYCTTDTTVSSVGGEGKAGQMSPRNMWTTTITDELRLASNFKSRVFGISLKDRGAILPAGHSANAAYWYDSGKWITSTYYMNNLPEWVKAYNQKDMPGEMMKKDWNTLYPIGTYALSDADDVPYEGSFSGLKTSNFPHLLSTIGKEKYEAFRTTPYANTYSLDFAKQLISNEKLGTGVATDFLAISLSSPDYMGHTFGPNSIEAEDSYLRLDADIAQFLSFLDSKFGNANYLLFLTADHGAAHIPAYLNANKIPAGTFNQGKLETSLNVLLEEKFGLKNLVLEIQNYQVYLDVEKLKTEKKDIEDVKEAVVDYLKTQPFITNVLDLEEMGEQTLAEPLKTLIVNGYNSVRSGDIQFVVKPAWFDGGAKGTTHGMWNPYDTHIPCVFFGWNVKPGKSYRTVSMSDIAPTLAAMLRIQMPNASIGHVLFEIVK